MTVGLQSMLRLRLRCAPQGELTMEKIATDTYDFEYMRSKGFTYVDKTDILYLLVDESLGKQFFLTRPRRFGKSLLLSTTQKLFEGRRDLFEGLAIDSLPWDWSATYPVIRLDMSMCSGETLEEVEAAVTVALQQEARRLGAPLHEDEEPREQFRLLVEDVAAAGPAGQLVLLIDEYDKPLTRWVGTPEVAPFQAFLKSFYSVVKGTESKQRFCLMTGVSKFSKVSIFSDLNNLTDITMDARFSSLLGYTHEEVRSCFPQRLAALAQSLGTDADGAFERLVDMYDGYSFDRSMTRVFNPVSLGRCLDAGDMRSYWFETGTPSWLMSYARKAPMEVEHVEVSEDQLGTFEPADPFMPAVLFQTGYLTIKGFEERGRRRSYTLGFPNHEVEDGFNAWLADAYTKDAAATSGWRNACYHAVREGDCAGFVEALTSLFASIGYDLTDRLSEQAYQCVVVAILRYIGVDLSAEMTTSRGRIDMVCFAPGNVVVVELKVASGQAAGERAADEAMRQIHERGYAERFACDARRVQLLGISFDCETHNIAAWKCEGLDAER